METESAAETAFWAAIAAAAADDLPKLVFADWLDERGDPMGRCLRWVVAEHKRPAYDPLDTKTWDWWSRTPADPLFYENSPCEYLLPLNLFTRLTPYGPGIWKNRKTYIDALRQLCVAWKECADESVDPLSDDRPRDEGDAGLAAHVDSGV